jgi:hypothetical protein
LTDFFSDVECMKPCTLICLALFSFSVLCSPFSVQAQPLSTEFERSIMQKYGATRDAYDWLGLRSAEEDSILMAQANDPTPGKTRPMTLILIPVIAGNPNLGLQVGVAGQAGYFLGPAENTRMSTTQGCVTVTTKDQTIISMQTTANTSGDAFQINTDWRYYIFSQNTFGLGTSAPEGTPVFGGINIGGIETEGIPGQQPMDFNYLRLHQSATFRITNKVYLGLGYMYDHHFKIVDENLDLAADTPAVTSHWAYSKYFGFDSSNYSLGGVALEAIYDGRDNPISPFVGPYARISYRENQTWLGSSQAAGQLWAEFRTYISLDDILPRHLFGIWAWYAGVAHGNLPYLDLPAIGYDFNGRSGRGYLQGRFRGPQMVYLEGEYRFPISKNGMFGGVVFANFTTASRPSLSNLPDAEQYDLALFDRIRPAGGVGLRIMAQKYSRTSLNIDAGFTSDRQLALYFSVGEAF